MAIVKGKSVIKTKKEMSLPCPYCNKPFHVKIISAESGNSFNIQYYSLDENNIEECVCENCKKQIRVRIVNNFIMIVKKEV